MADDLMLLDSALAEPRPGEGFRPLQLERQGLSIAGDAIEIVIPMQMLRVAAAAAQWLHRRRPSFYLLLPDLRW